MGSAPFGTDGPALGSRALFPALAPRAYLNFAAISPPSTAVLSAVNAGLSLYAASGAAAVGDAISQRNRLKVLLGTLLGAAPDALALVANTTTGVADIASCFPWAANDRVLTFHGEFPANVTPWQTAAAFGVRTELAPLPMRPDGSTDLEAFDRALETKTRLVAISAVQFQTGWRVDLAGIVEVAHRRGAEVFVDAIQGAGVVPIDVTALGVDYLVTGSHKWLMGTEGLAALYIAPAALDRLLPRRAGWLSHEGAIDFLFRGAGHLRYDRPLRQRADRFELGAPNGLGARALEASVGLIMALGVDAIFDHVQRFHDLLEPALVARGFRSVRASHPGGRSGTLSVLPPGGSDVVAWQRDLLALGVAASIPDGYLRFSPHWPCALSEVDLVVDAIDQVARGG
jgi:cysteine desulfurase/selenocysteine lyase